MKKIISILLYHANKYPELMNKAHFYKIKTILVKNYGVLVGYDLQYIEGKVCFSCCGTGDHERYGFHGEVYAVDSCWSCNGTGWYKSPQYNVLERYQVGEYVFHQPVQRYYSKRSFEQSPFSELVTQKIEGYIEHSKGNRNIAQVFYFLFMTRFWYDYHKKNFGVGYYRHWWKPYNFIHNLFGLFRSKMTRHFFVEHLKSKFQFKTQNVISQIYQINTPEDDLPF